MRHKITVCHPDGHCYSYLNMKQENCIQIVYRQKINEINCAGVYRSFGILWTFPSIPGPLKVNTFDSKKST